MLIKHQYGIGQSQTVHGSAAGKQAGERNALAARIVLAGSRHHRLRIHRTSRINHRPHALGDATRVLHDALSGFISSMERLSGAAGTEERNTSSERIAVLGENFNGCACSKKNFPRQIDAGRDARRLERSTDSAAGFLDSQPDRCKVFIRAVGQKDRFGPLTRREHHAPPKCAA